VTDGTGQSVVQVEFVENLRLAELGDSAAQFCVSCAFQGAIGTPQNPIAAAMWLERSSRQGYGAAQGLCALFGVGTPINANKGFKILQTAALAGLREAQFYVGDCHEVGLGTIINPKEAVKWYRLAAEQGHARAQCNLGVCCAQGTGVSQDAHEAVKWYRLAAEQGFARAQCHLGFCCENGSGLSRDATKPSSGIGWRRSKG
jgi:TPR repeat protein